MSRLFQFLLNLTFVVNLISFSAFASTSEGLDLSFIQDTACEIKASPLEILAMPTTKIVEGPPIYKGCLYYIVQLRHLQAEAKEPVINYRNVYAAQNIWRVRGSDVISVVEKRYGYVSTLSLDGSLPGDSFIFKYEYLSYLTSYLRPSLGTFQITDHDAAITSALGVRTVQGFCYALFLMNIVTFLSFIKTNPRYKFYVGYASSLLLFLESANGLVPEFLGLPHYRAAFSFWQTFVQLSGAISGVLIVLYIESFFNYKSESRYVSYIFKAFLVMLGLSGLVSFVDINIGHNLTNLSLTGGIGVMLFITFYSTYIKKQMSQLIFLGFIVTMITQTIFLLAVTGKISLGIYLYSIILMGFSYEAVFFAIGTTKVFNSKFAKSIQTKFHLINQLRKIVYPHQLRLIGDGSELESTMPTGPGEACVISFDIAGSSKIQHEKAKEFFRNVFRRCNEAMMEGYDEVTVESSAYRIKEMGDGFLCSVGYPFRSKTGYMAKDALALAAKFGAIFEEEVSKLKYRDPIHYGIGIALDHITGFYPETGTKEYDLYGRAIVLATRYEGMRKIILKDKDAGSIIIIQERVLLSLDAHEASEFTEYDLKKNGAIVRDDPAATKIYYKFIKDVDQPTVRNLTAV